MEFVEPAKLCLNEEESTDVPKKNPSRKKRLPKIGFRLRRSVSAPREDNEVTTEESTKVTMFRRKLNPLKRTKANKTPPQHNKVKSQDKEEQITKETEIWYRAELEGSERTRSRLLSSDTEIREHITNEVAPSSTKDYDDDYSHQDEDSMHDSFPMDHSLNMFNLSDITGGTVSEHSRNARDKNILPRFSEQKSHSQDDELSDHSRNNGGMTLKPPTSLDHVEVVSKQFRNVVTPLGEIGISNQAQFESPTHDSNGLSSKGAVADKIHRIRRKLNPRGNRARWRYRIERQETVTDEDTIASGRERDFLDGDDESMWEWNNDDQSTGSGAASDNDAIISPASNIDKMTFGDRIRSKFAGMIELDRHGSLDSASSDVPACGVYTPPTEGIAIRNFSDGREFRVRPYHTFDQKPLYMTEKEIYNDMMKPSQNAELLRSFIVPTYGLSREAPVTQMEQYIWGNPDDGRIGSIRVEVLSCLGLTKHKPDTCVYLVCGDCAFATDVLHGSRSPMWPSKSKRAAVFPIHHAFIELFVGVFDVLPKRISDNDDFCGRVVLDISSLRPNSEYDVTLPLRASSFIYDRQPRGVIRLRFSLHWFSERAAVLSYFRNPQLIQTTNTCTDAPSILCADPKTFRNIAVTIHGKDLPGKYSRKAFQATMREFNLYQSNIRLLVASLVKDAVCYKKPLLSLYFFLTWMHCVIANSVRLLPAYFVGLLIFFMIDNYNWYILNESSNLGYVPPTISEIFMALVFDSHSGSFAPLLTRKKARDALQRRSIHDGQQVPGSRTFEGEIHHREFPFSDKMLYPKIAVEEALVKRHRSAKGESHEKMQMAGRLSIYVKTGKGAGIHSGHDRNGIRNDDTSTHDNQENDDDEEENLLVNDHDDMEYLLGLGMDEVEDQQLDEAETVVTNKGLFVKRQGLVGPPQDADVRPKKTTPPQVHLARVEDQLNKFTKSIFIDRVYMATLPLRPHANIGSNTDERISPDSFQPPRLTDEETRKRRLPLDDFDKRLGLRVRHPNPVVEITSTFLGPLMRIFRVFCNIFRAGFNATTWKDPFLSFWTLCFLIVLMLVLIFFPWRIFFGVTGFILFGPQNVLISSEMEKLVNKRHAASVAVLQEATKRNKTDNTPSSIGVSEDIEFTKTNTHNRIQERIGAALRIGKKAKRNNAAETNDRNPGHIVNGPVLHSVPVKSEVPLVDRPVFTTRSNAWGNKKNLSPREVLVPYSRFRKERFYDFPPDPTVSRCSVIKFDDCKMPAYAPMTDDEQVSNRI